MAEQSYSPEYRQSWALIIGIDEYQDPSLPPLQTAVKGARAVARLLQDELGFDPERITCLENEAATQRTIRRAFADPLGREDKVGPDDRVLFYFGGHGLTYDTAEGTIGCIAPYDIEASYWDTAIPMDTLTRFANRCHAKHVLFLLDACFSGYATVREVDPSVRRQVEDFLINPARQVIAAGTRDQAVSDLWGPGQHSLFTGFLLDGLRGAAPAPGGVLRAFHLAGYLQDQVAQHSRSRQTPQYAALMGSSGGDFVFSVRDVVELPEWLVATAESSDPTQRMVAASHLLTTAQGDDPRLSNVALAYRERLADDDNPLVRSAATTALEQLAPAPAPPAPEDVREEPVIVQLPPEEPPPPPIEVPSLPKVTLAPVTEKPEPDVSAPPGRSIWLSVLVTAIGFAIGGAIWGFGPRIAVSIYPTDYPGIGFPIAGAIGGFTTGSALRRAEPSTQWKQVGLVTLSWAIGVLIGVLIVEAIAWPIGWPIGFAIAGAIGAGMTFWQLSRARRAKMNGGSRQEL